MPNSRLLLVAVAVILGATAGIGCFDFAHDLEVCWDAGRCADPGAPGPPLSVVATAGESRATITWMPPADNGGSPITAFAITSTPASASLEVAGGETSVTVTGLINGTTYVFTVVARNAAGSSMPAQSNPVTPGATLPDAGLPDAGFPYAPSNFLPGPLSWPDAGLTISCDAGYDTTSTSGWFCGGSVPAAVPITMAGGAQAILLPLGPLTITAAGRLTLVGNRPLILAVQGDARIDGPLLAGADRWRPGPGGSRPSCPGTGWLGADGGYAGGGGGGGGGGYGQSGARGGLGGSNGPGPGGNGGATFGSATLAPLLGGCSGGEGGENESQGLRTGGAGGGAIQVSASGVLRIQAAVAAPGAGGEGGEPVNRCGGGGGGSGGGILLEALRLELGPDARLTANGGAGSEGSDPGGSTFQFGENGRIDGPYPARGGNTAAFVGSGGDGGAGGVSPTPGRDYPTSSGGGGGGGGGVGRIRINSVQGCILSGSRFVLFSPQPTSNLAGDAGCP